MSQMVATVNEDNVGTFWETVNEYQNQGYKISSSSCGYYDTVGGEFVPKQYWMAILVKEDEI